MIISCSLCFVAKPIISNINEAIDVKVNAYLPLCDAFINPKIKASTMGTIVNNIDTIVNSLLFRLIFSVL